MRQTIPLFNVNDRPSQLEGVLKAQKRLQEACLVRIYPAGLTGSHVSLSGARLVIGRSPECHCEINDDHASREHAAIEIHDGKHRLTDLGSTNGTFVNNARIKQHDLDPGDHIRIGHHIFKYLCSDHVEAMYHEAVFEMITTDGLTQTYNRRYFEDAFEREVLRSTRHGRRLGLLILDIDHFKQLNDKHGHLVGDDLLAAFCRRIKRRIRGDELFARIGGEEFSLVVVEISRSELEQLAASLLDIVAGEPFELGTLRVPMTISIGGTHTSGLEPITSKDLWNRADAKLYDAKRAGRNRACI